MFVIDFKRVWTPFFSRLVLLRKVGLIVAALTIGSIAYGKSSGQSSTWIPIFGSTSTYGFFMGAAYMRYPTTKFGSYFSVRGMATMHPFWNGGVSFHHWTPEGSIYRTDFTYSGWFDPYYGEGNATLPENRVNILFHYARFSQERLWGVTENLFLGLFLEARYREEREVLDSSQSQFFALESTPVGGLLLEYDSRDSRYSPQKGYYGLARWSWYPGSGSNLDTLAPFQQWEIETRRFQKIGIDSVWALRLALGISDGDPSYLYRYSVGGPELLRGFQKNRFRGKKYYGIQNEIRTPLKKYLSGVAFFEVGDVTDDQFSDILESYGVGLRFGLPPDHQMKVRLDVGFSRDQTAFSILFDHAF